MFKRKIKLRDSRVIEKIEEFLGESLYGVNSSEVLTPEELYALRYSFGDYKININSINSISRIRINDLFCPKYVILTMKLENGSFITADTIASQKNVIPLLNQRLLLFAMNDGTIESIRVYIPSYDDITLDLSNLVQSYVDAHFDFSDINFYVQDDKITNQMDWSKEFFAHTNQKVGNSTIVLHYAP